MSPGSVRIVLFFAFQRPQNRRKSTPVSSKPGTQKLFSKLKTVRFLLTPPLRISSLSLASKRRMANNTMIHLSRNVVSSPLYDRLVAVRRQLHQNPELSWEEAQTANTICHFLDDLGIRYDRDIAGHGVVAHIPGRSESPMVALRADIDALPIVEETGLPFASSVHGTMHACGHDGHTSMLLGAASLLVQEDDLPTSVKLIFQPAEETGAGSKAMIEAGVLNDVGMIFGGHVDRHFPVGTVVVTEGAVNASSDQFLIDIHGRGGHAARPQETVDAVVVGSLMIMALQTIVSREINPAHPSVVTVGRFDAGSAHNVIAAQAHLEGSIRAQDEEVRWALHRSIERMANSIGQLHGAAIDIRFIRGTPPLINPPASTAIARRAANLVVSSEEVLEMDTANMGGEDFSYYLAQCPGCYVRFGSARNGVEQYPAHSSKFDIDEEVLAVGAAYFHAVAHVAGQKIVECQQSRMPATF